MSNTTALKQKRSWLKAGLLASLIGFPIFLTGCTTTTQPKAEMPEPGRSIYADYLVGQYAVRHRQMDMATDFLSSVQKSDELPKSFADSLDRQLFTILAGEGRIHEAVEAAQSLKNKDLMSRVVFIVHAVEQGDMEQALENAKQIPRAGLGGYIKPLVLAWVSAGSQDVDTAIKALDRLKGQKGLEALYNMHVGLLNEFAGRLKKAEEHYHKAAAVGSNGISLRLAQLYGRLLAKQGRMDEAEKVYRRYFASNPSSLYIQAMLDELKSGNLTKTNDITVRDGVAETLFGLASSLRSDSTRQAGLIMGRLALHVKPDFPIAQILVAEILETDRRFDDANKIYATIANDNPFSWSARLRMALNMDDIGQTDEAITTLEEMIKQHPDRLEVYMTLGDVLRHHEHFDKAQDVYGKAIALLGDNVQRHHWNLFYSRAITLERLKRWDEAEVLFLKALELQPNQPFVLNYLGYSWIEIGRNMEKAKKMIEDAVAQRPRDGYIVDSLGWVLYRLGEYEKAVPHLERAVELQPSDPVINDHLGDAYWKVGRNREARFQWSRARSLNPEPDILSIIEEKLKNGLSDDK